MNGRRDPLAVAAVVLAAVAFAGSFTHVRETVEQHGQAGWLSFAIAAMPEMSVLLAVVKVRRDGVRQPWAWIVGGTAAAFTVAANLAVDVPEPLTGTAAEVAALVEADPDLSVSEIARRVGKSRTTVARHLQRLAPVG